MRDPETGERRFARIKVPPVLPRLVEVGQHTYILLEQIIAANLDALFPGMEVLEHHLFRVTRNADLAIEEDEADDLLMAIEEELRKRRFGAAVRLEVERSMPAATRALLQRGLGIQPTDVYEVAGMLDLTALDAIAELDMPGLQREPWQPVTPQRLQPLDEDEAVDVFAVIRDGDLLVHHPYESFRGSVQRFVEQAADDPDVLGIKMTLYRTGGDSPIVRALIRAAEQGKQVVVLVEIKARFDERANIVWARALERAGAHVVYGLVGLKTHCKVTLVVRREGRGLRRYVHIGTGNYNDKTARLYVDVGLLSCGEELGADATDLFNFLTGLSRQRSFRRLVIAPVSLRSTILELIEGEIARQRASGDGRIRLKLNAVVDPEMVGALCRASQAGVPVDIIARGACSLRPGRRGGQRERPRALDHRALPGALAHLRLRRRRPRTGLHRFGRPHGAQPGPPRRGRRAGHRAGPGGAAADGRGRHAGRRPAGLAARPRRSLAAGGDAARVAHRAGHVRGLQGPGAGVRPGRGLRWPTRSRSN